MPSELVREYTDNDIKRTGQVENELTRLEKAIAVQREQITQLLDRLGPVHRPTETVTGAGNPVPSPVLVPLAERISGLVSQAEANNRRLAEIFEGIEL